MKTNTLNTLYINEDGFIFLSRLQREQRTGKPFTSRSEQLCKQNFERFAVEGWKQIFDGDFGGAENGKWILWSCEDLKRILYEAGFEFLDGKPEQVFIL